MIGSIILAGGAGNRIGGDKPFIDLMGKKLILYVIEAASSVSDEIIVVVDVDEEHKFTSIVPENVDVVVDLMSGRGPLIGLYSGLRQICSEYAVVLPCDSPFINREVLRCLFSKVRGVDAVIPRWPNGYIEPLHSIYKVSASLKHSQEAIGERKFKILDMIDRLEKPEFVSVESLKKFDPELLTFFNINSLEDLVKAEAIMK